MELLYVISLILLSSLFFTTALNVFFWKKAYADNSRIIGSVSVLIPARNEAANIIQCLECLEGQQNIHEILVYDDHSTDGTADAVRVYSERNQPVRVIPPSDLPDGWTGKNFACHRLAAEAKAEWLLFIDADTRFSKGAVSAIVAQATKWKATFISCWPSLEMRSFWEKLLMPMLNFFVYSVYPAPISFRYDMPSLGIAHGACIMMKRDSYHKMGGHSRVRDKIFEDTELSRLWRTGKERSLCFDGREIVKVRMYESLKDIWSGFQKNIYPGFKSDISFWLFIIFHTVFFLLPFIFFYISIYVFMMMLIVWTMRTLLAFRFKHPLWTALLHPIAEIFLLALAVSSWWRCASGKGVSWKGRTYLAKN